jgi:transcriptional regulator with XRE-family HTH domain
VLKATNKIDLDQRWIRNLGTRIRAQRKAAGLTQERLAELADVAPRTIQKIEAGDITILVTTLARIRRAIGCRCDDLVPD